MYAQGKYACDEKLRRAGVLSRFTRDPTALSNVLKYHVVADDLSRDDLKSQTSCQVETLDNKNKLRINKYSSYPYGRETVYTAQCVPLERMDLRACNAKIYLVNQVLTAPRGDVVDILSTDSRFSTLVSLLKQAGIADSLQLSGPFTVFAPTNQAFQRLNSQVTQALTQRSNVDRLRRVLQHHVTYGFICCAGVFENRWRRGTRMLDGSDVLLDRRSQEVMVNSVRVTLCDQTATNGVVHAIGDVIPEAIQRYVTGGMRNSNYYYYRYYRDYRGK